uniref:Y_5 protein n=1 Tax=Fopius arisanus TaxID=64838 RepID=A0A0C9RW01_9HYME
MMLKCFVVALAIGCTFARHLEKETVQWTGGNVDWPCSSTECLYKNGGKYINKNMISTRAVIYNNEAILAFPRFKKGVPLTLGIIPLDCKTGEPSVSPYPSWSLQEEGNCGALQSVVDLFLDPQNVLWVLDTGIIDALEETPVRKCPPKVVAINVRTGKMVKAVDLSSLTGASSRLQYVVADYSADGRVFVYVTDAAARAILVYDVTSDKGYRVVLPKAVTMGCTKRDVLYPSLVRRLDGSTVLLFSYLCSDQLFSIRTEYLQTGAAAGKIHDIGTKPGKLIFLGTDNGSAVFFRFEGHTEIYRWDASTPFCPENCVKVYDGQECTFPSEVIPDYKKGRMRVLESNFPDFIRGTVGCGIDHSLVVM